MHTSHRTDTPAANNNHVLSESDRNALAREYLPWAEAVLVKRYGADAAEHAGMAIFNALQTYDGRIPFKNWLSQQIDYTSRVEHRAFEGRVGSRKHQSRMRSVTIQPNDRVTVGGSDDFHNAKSPDTDYEEREELCTVLQEIEDMEPVARWVILGRFLVGASNHDIGQIIGREANHIGSAISSI